MSVSINDQPYDIEITEENVSATISTVGAQGATGPQGPTGPTGPQGPSGVIAVTAPITNSGTSTSAQIGINDGTTAQKGAVQLEDSTSSTSTSKAATPNSVKSAYDLANGKPSLSSSNPVALGTAAPGVGTTAARTDHVHPTTGLLLSASASAARPLLTSGAYLSGSGLVLSGIASNYASSPDSAALSITGDIDIKVKVALTDWTPTANNCVLGKYGAGGDRSYFVRIDTGGTISLITSADGTNILTGTSTVATGISDGTTKWVRATLDVDNGSGGRSYKFYTSDDASTWTQLGTTVTAGATTSIFNSAISLEVGSRNAGSTELMTGTVYRTLIQSGFDNGDNTTNVAFDANFETATADALAFTESSANAATVTINTTRYFYGLPNVELETTATTSMTLNRDHYSPFFVEKAITVDMGIFEVTTGPASASTVNFAIYASDDNMQPTGSPLVAQSQSVGSGATGIFRKQFTPVTLQPGPYLMAYNNTVNTTYRTPRGGTIAVPNAMGASTLLNFIWGDRTSATFTTPATSWTNLFAGTAGFYHYVLLRWKAA